jgi:hypothetical protein
MAGCGALTLVKISGSSKFFPEIKPSPGKRRRRTSLTRPWWRARWWRRRQSGSWARRRWSTSFFSKSHIRSPRKCKKRHFYFGMIKV